MLQIGGEREVAELKVAITALYGGVSVQLLPGTASITRRPVSLMF